MNKRKLIHFLIFTVSIFYFLMLDSAFAQETSLAQKVFERYNETLTREDIQEVLPAILNTLRDPAFQSHPWIQANPHPLFQCLNTMSGSKPSHILLQRRI